MATEDLKCEDFMRGNIYRKKAWRKQESLAEPSDHRCLKHEGEKEGSSVQVSWDALQSQKGLEGGPGVGAQLVFTEVSF